MFKFQSSWPSFVFTSLKKKGNYLLPFGTPFHSKTLFLDSYRLSTLLMFWITVDVADDDHVLSFDNILLVITY